MTAFHRGDTKTTNTFGWLASLIAFLIATQWSASARADSFGSGANQFTIDFVTIGDPGNAPDLEGNPTPSGAVDYVYRIATHEISEQMVDKAVAEGDLPEIFFRPRRGPDKPVTDVSWVEAAIFVNWLNSEVGAMPAYKITPPPPPFINQVFNLWDPSDPGFNPANPYRNSLARYFLPTADEWYKAAYYDPVEEVYHDFPIGRHAAPQSVASGTDPFTAVFNRGGPADVTAAGGLSSYGTMGQGGNVFELVETSHDRTNDEVHEPREFRGGYWQQGADDMKRFSRDCLCFGPYSFGSHIGFRVASVEAAPLPGDYNGDGTVDATDYVVWRKNNGMPQEYESWRANFGRTAGSGNAAAGSQFAFAVPEPLSCALALVAMMIAALGRRAAGQQNREPRK